MSEEVKPGVKTTEFWLASLGALAGPIVMILVHSGVLSPDTDVDSFTRQILEIISLVGGLLSPPVAAAAYSKSRGQVKTASVQAQVIKTQLAQMDVQPTVGRPAPPAPQPGPRNVVYNEATGNPVKKKGT